MEHYNSIYLDLDNVVSDFYGAYAQITKHKATGNEQSKVMWNNIKKADGFFRNMPMIEGAKEFFDELNYIAPVICITSCSFSNFEKTALEKRAWVKQNLGSDIFVIPTCDGVHKGLYMARPDDVLIDDTHKNCANWEAHGGIAIQHTSFEDSLDKVRGLFT